MAIFGKKDDTKAKKPVKDNVLDMVQASEEKKTETKAKASKENTGDAYAVLLKQIVSEKSYSQAGMSKYIFKVNPKANKISVRKAIEKVYDVNVVRVNMIRTPGKKKTSGRISGRTSDYKKAIVTLKAGQQIA